MLFFSGDTDLNELIDSLQDNPEILTTPYFPKHKPVEGGAESIVNELYTGETIVHLLAKEGCVEILRKLLDFSESPKVDKCILVEALLRHDESGWSPLMSAMKADRNVEPIIEMFLKFLEIEAATEDVQKMINIPKEVKAEINNGNVLKLH